MQFANFSEKIDFPKLSAWLATLERQTFSNIIFLKPTLKRQFAVPNREVVQRGSFLGRRRGDGDSGMDGLRQGAHEETRRVA